jgi:hypothetical protein
MNERVDFGWVGPWKSAFSGVAVVLAARLMNATLSEDPGY